MRAAIIAAFLVVLTSCSYLFGQHQGRNSEELKNARAQISVLTAALEEHKAKQTSDAVALAELRVAESRARDEYEWMRSQLAILESRASKTNTDRERNRCLRLAVEGRELLGRAQAAIKFCEQNHK